MPGKKWLILWAGVLAILCGSQTNVPAQQGKEKTSPRLDRSGDPLPDGAIARLGSLRFRYFGFAFVVSPDGKSYATGSWDKVFIVDVASGKVRMHFDVDGLCGPLAFSPDGKILAVVGGKKLNLWDLERGRIVHTKPGFFNPILFSPKGDKMVLGVNHDDLLLWDLHDGKVSWKREKSPEDSFVPYPLVFSSDGKVLLTQFNLQEGMELGFLDAATGKEVRKRTKLPKNTSEFKVSPDAKSLVRASWFDGGDIDLEEVDTGKTLLRLGGFKYGDRLAFSPNSKLLAWGSKKRITVLDVGRGRELHRLEEFEDIEKVISHGIFMFLPDSKTIAFSVKQDKVLSFWNIDKKKELLPPHDGHADMVLQLAFTKDSQKLLSGSPEGSVRLWEPKTGKELDRLAVRFDFGSALDSTGKICVGDFPRGKAVFVWDFFKKKRLHQLEGNEGGMFFPPVLSPDGKVLAIRKDGRIGLWDLQAEKEVRPLKTKPFNDMAFSPDGKYLAVAGKEIAFWRTSGNEPKPSFSLRPRMFDRLAFSSDGKLLAAASGSPKHGEAVVFDIPSGKMRLCIEGPRSAVAISPNGATLALGNSNGKVTVWDTGKNQMIRELDGHLALVHTLAFSPDGRYLASGSWDTTILIWDVGDLRRNKPAKK